MNKLERLNRPQPDNLAFTRVDLVVLLAILAVLVVVAVPSLGRVTQTTVIAQCAANLQQYDLTLQIYGNENQDNLPVNSSGFWPWDSSRNIVAFITNTGVKWTALYCPGTAPRFSLQDNFGIWTYNPYPVLGYASALSGPSEFANIEGSYIFATNVDLTLTMQRINYFATSLPVKPALRALVADATISADPGTAPPPAGAALNAAMLTYNWVDISSGYGRHRLSAHLNGRVPLGGNLGMLDGHVEWRNFHDMLPRSGGNGDPYFYW
jgi:prepilin-type processing-associated H-X9-DG protein